MLFTYELARRLDPASITATCLSPGLVPGTSLDREGGLAIRLIAGGVNTLPDTFLSVLPNPIKTVEQGARTPVYLASDPDAKYVSGWYLKTSDLPSPRPSRTIHASRAGSESEASSSRTSRPRPTRW